MEGKVGEEILVDKEYYSENPNEISILLHL